MEKKEEGRRRRRRNSGGKKKKEGRKKQKQNKTKIMTNQDRKHGFKIKTDTLDALTKGELIKWTWWVMIKTERIQTKVNTASDSFFIARGAVFTLVPPGLGLCQEAKRSAIRIKVSSAPCKGGKYDS